MWRNKRHRWLIVALCVAIAAVFVIHIVADRVEQHSLQESYPTTNYSCIEDGLFLGGIVAEPPPGTRAVLNVCETKDPYRVEAHCWNPIADAAPAPSIDWVRRQVEFIDEQRRAGRLVFVHCRAGVSRSVMVIAAYLMWRDGCSRDDALHAIRAKRPTIGPNPAFMHLLLEWEQAVKKRADRASPTFLVALDRSDICATTPGL
jgi:hypothetical protein